MSTQVRSEITEASLNFKQLDLQSFIERIPKLSQAALQAITIVSEESFDFRKLANVLETEPSLVINIIKIANSSFYGLNGSVRNVHDACMVLGQHTLHNLITAASVLNVVDSCKNKNSQVDILTHSLHTAFIARLLALACDEDGDFAYIAGLLHDIGSVLLQIVFPEKHQNVLRYKENQNCALGDAESAIIGFNHAQLSAKVAQHWHLSDQIADAIGAHHEPEAHLRKETLIIYVADLLSTCMIKDQSPEAICSQFSETVFSRLAMSISDFEAFINKCPSYKDVTISKDINK